MQEINRVLVAMEPPPSSESIGALHWALTELVKPGVDEVVLIHVVKIPSLIPTASKIEILLDHHAVVMMHTYKISGETLISA
jgi:hypothetical protein